MPARCALKCQAVGCLWSGAALSVPGPRFKPGPLGPEEDEREDTVPPGAAELLCSEDGGAPPLPARRGDVPRKPRDMECFGHCPDTHSWSRAGQERARVIALLTQHARWETGL